MANIRFWGSKKKKKKIDPLSIFSNTDMIHPDFQYNKSSGNPNTNHEIFNQEGKN